MSLSIESTSVPLSSNEDGVMQVGTSRVPLETVITAFQNGATAEEIVYQYPALELADVYSVIGYYLNNQSQVDTYVQQRRHAAAGVRQQNEARFDPHNLRGRLLARIKKI